MEFFSIHFLLSWERDGKCKIGSFPLCKIKIGILAESTSRTGALVGRACTCEEEVCA